MPALASDLRKTLENTVVKAREKAEGGARDALTALAVGASEPFGSMSEDERKLRNRLRARGRQLGDQRDPQKGSQGIERLVREMAYEHWHRMLFARFLAENQLLIEPSSGVSISLDECEELAAEEGTDLWGLAAQFAQAMLPQIFRTDDPVLAAKLPLEIRQQLQALVAGLEAETFTASDSLGWTYQFWQTKRKKEVNDSGVKIGADEISPVTQLFTEDYMVDFLLDNTLGAWHAGKVLAENPHLASNAQAEDDLRQVVALPGCPWSYLRFVKSDDGSWAPAAGTFEGWPNTAAELKCLDPCMGSGHFVVAMFERMVALRMEEEGVSEQTAVAAVIQVNLYGLEIDPRCTQIAAFNLALAAWRLVGHCKLPAMNLACSGLAPNTPKAEWMVIAGENERLRNGMERLYRLFEKAAVLGSLINPLADDEDLLVAGFQELQPLLEQVLVQESNDDTSHELAVTARGLAKTAEVLAGKFTLVATNVPYLGRGKQDEAIKDYCERIYPVAKADLATCFIERSLDFCSSHGSTSLVAPQNWLFLGTYKQLRRKKLAFNSWDFIARLGAKAFHTPMWDFNVCLVGISRQQPAKDSVFAGWDVGELSRPEEKGEDLQGSLPSVSKQQVQLGNPDHRVALGELDDIPLLSVSAVSLQGTTTGDNPQFLAHFWELALVDHKWDFFQGSVSEIKDFGGCEYIVRWEQGEGDLSRSSEARVQGLAALGKRGILVSQMGELPATRYGSRFFSMNTAVLLPKKEDHLPAIWALCSSREFTPLVRAIDQALKVTNASLVKIPFDIAHWQKVAAEKYPQGLPKPYSNDPAQWLFNGHPVGADQPLHVAVARLVGYLWPRQSGTCFPDCPALVPDGLEALADDDGIVCLSPIRGEAAAADRLRGILGATFGDEWSNAKERELLLETAVANNAKTAAADLSDWLRQNFFAEHCKLFDSRYAFRGWDERSQDCTLIVHH